VQQMLPAAAAASMHGLQLLAPAVASGVDLGSCTDATEALRVMVYIQLAFISKPFPDEDSQRQQTLVAGAGLTCCSSSPYQREGTFTCG
jgi:hypothetical protein